MKIVDILIALRKKQYDGRYTLPQDRLLKLLSNQWGHAKPSSTIHHIDRVRVYGIVMSIPKNRPQYERLAGGCTVREHHDDPGFSPKEIFQNIALSFNNDDIEWLMRVDR